MNTTFMKQYFLATFLFMSMGMLTGCGGDDSIPAPEQTQKDNNTSSNGNNNQQEQPQGPELKIIEPSVIAENAEEGEVSVKMAEQSGGRAVLTATVAETKAATQIVIVGIYDSENGCYTFDLSVLDSDATYSYVISVYDKDGKKVMESKQKTITLPESAVIDERGSGGGSDGTRGVTSCVEAL